MLAAMFVHGGIDQVQHPEEKLKRVGPFLEQFSEQGQTPVDPALLVRVNGAVMVVGGLMLSSGRLPRLAAAALAATLVPTTLGGHAFWEIEDPQQRAQQRIHFLKNVAMLGGLLLAATDTEGAPSLSWRAKRAAKRTLGSR
jgi:putative oxidoreductase